MIFILSQEALQFYDTPKSIKQALGTSDTQFGEVPQPKEKSESQCTEKVNDFAGPYGNYDIPHAGTAPIPVFRKACGCVMKLIPQVNVPQCVGGNLDGSGNTVRAVN